MKQAFFAAAAALGSLALAPMAQAQASCEQIEAIIEYAWDDFSDITGEEISDGVFETSYYFDGAEICGVTMDFLVEYTCLFTFATEEEGADGLRVALDRLSSCLPEWPIELSDATTSNTDTVTLESHIATGPDDLSDLEWYVTLERHEAEQGVDWHVLVGLSYF